MSPPGLSPSGSGRDLPEHSGVILSEILLAYDGVAVAILDLVAEGPRIARANPAFQRILGYSENELRSRGELDLTHTADVAESRRWLEELAAGGRSSGLLEKRYVSKTGAPVWVHLTALLLKPEGEGPTRLALLAEDVTERKLLEREQLTSSRYLQALLESAVDAIITIDPAGIIQLVNPATERMFGYDADRLVGTNVKVLMPSPYREEHDGYLARYRETGEKRIIGIGREVEGRHRDGRVFPVDLAVSEFRAGEDRLFMAMIRDLTDRRMLEESLLQSQKMEAIGRLAGGVAHDFNTLLGTITGYAEMLLEEAGESGSPSHQYAAQVFRAARRGADLTGQLLAFSRQEESHPRRLDLAALTAETGDMVRRLICEDIALELHVGEEIGSVVMDAGQLQQLLLNLAINAADSMHRGGRLSVKWSRQELVRETPLQSGTLGAGTYAVLEVADTGTGMSEETRSHIFEPFFTTKERGKGTGLGLYTVFGIVRQWGGAIDCTTEPSVGTTFRVFFPESEAGAGVLEEARDRASSGPRQGQPSETLLLVEDDEMFRDLAGQVLESSGYRVLTAGDPEEAVSRCGLLGEEVDVLITDLVMPGGNGADLAVSLKARYPKLRVILMSGYSDEVLASRDLAEPHLADAFLQKPFQIADLRRTIRLVLKGEATGS